MIDNTPINPDLLSTITRYLAYDWEWRVIKDVINYYFGTSYTMEQLI